MPKTNTAADKTLQWASKFCSDWMVFNTADKARHKLLGYRRAKGQNAETSEKKDMPNVPWNGNEQILRVQGRSRIDPQKDTEVD
jgi:hypothetical protein